MDVDSSHQEGKVELFNSHLILCDTQRCLEVLDHFVRGVAVEKLEFLQVLLDHLLVLESHSSQEPEFLLLRWQFLNPFDIPSFVDDCIPHLFQLEK